MVVQVSAENLAGNVPAGTPAPAEFDGRVPAETSTKPESDENVPAVTPAAAVCHMEGMGSVEPATAQRHACDSKLLGAVIDKHGKVLALGRTNGW